MKNRLIALGLLGVVGFVACGGDDEKPLLTPGGNAGSSAGKGSKAGSTATGEGGASGEDSGSGGMGIDAAGGTGKTNQGGDDAGGEGGAAEVPFGPPPTVTVLSPAAVMNPVTSNVLIGDSINVLCRAVPSDEPDAPGVNPATVKVAILDADGALVSEKDAAAAANADEYQGDVPLTLVASGKVSIQCSARSLGNVLGTDQHDTFVDHGPLLTLKTPLDGAQVGLKDMLKVQFEAVPQPLIVTGDTEAEVASVELSIAGVTVATTPVGAPGTYEADVDLNGNAFDPKPNGNIPLVIRATNKRTSTAVTSVKNHLILVDGEGPVISTTMDKALVGGTVKLSFTVTDVGSGVDRDSVIATLNTAAHNFDTNDNWSVNGDVFTYEFDSRNVTGSDVQITVKLQAKDNVQNAALEQTLTLYLDNVPPRVDLDPSPIRTKKLLDPFDCSTVFDPVGYQAANDEAAGSGYDLFRAFVWEQTNFVQGSPAVLHYAGTDQASVRLYFHAPTSATALLVNNKAPGSGTCNEIGDTSTPLDLDPLDTAGTPWYTVADAGSPACSTFVSSPSTAPAPLCSSLSDMHYVVSKADGQLVEPAVYVHSPTPGPECTGTAWEYRTFMDQADPDGWVCFAARAVDNIGNVGVSRPLRLCVDPDPDDGVDPNCMSTTVDDPPSCTDGCIPPTRMPSFIQLL